MDNTENKPELRRSVLMEVVIEVGSTAAGLVSGAGVRAALAEIGRALVVLLRRSGGRWTVDGVADSLLFAYQLSLCKCHSRSEG